VKAARRSRADDQAALIEIVRRVEEAFNDAFALDSDALSFLDDEFGVPVWTYTATPQREHVSELLSLNMERLVEHAKEVVGSRRYVVKKAYIADRSLELIAHITKAAPSTLVEIMATHTGELELRHASERIVSWCVGVAFGRWRIDAPGGLGTATSEDTFGIPTQAPGSQVRESKAARDILVDDEGHPDDLVSKIVKPLEINWGDGAVAEAEAKLGGIRNWIQGEFLSLHCGQYSKSRRKAPIYWQLATPSASYSVWLYIHAFSKDTLFRVQNDYVAPKLAHEERRLEALTAELRDGATATERKALAEQQALVEELRAFLAEVRRVAPLWNPNLDDGVIINFAPLWRLVPQNKAWQKELKATWDALCEGKYDWAHLAMHLWPERVVPKCATDRSLAIAHGLEDVFWQEDAAGKWRARVQGAGFRVQEVIDGLVRERTSAAVKDALKSLLEAGGVQGAGSRVRGMRRVQGSDGRVQGSGGGVQQRSSGTPNPDPQTLDAVKQAIAVGNGGASKSEVLAATSLTDAQWNIVINALLAAGTVTKTGAARGTRYHLTTDD
jgi:hypothetical protein